MSKKLGINISDASAAQLVAIGEAVRQTQTTVIERAIAMLYESVCQEPEDTAIVVGYIRMDRVGEIGAADACPVCGSEYGDRGIWMRVHATGALTGPLCSRCASSD